MGPAIRGFGFRVSGLFGPESVFLGTSRLPRKERILGLETRTSKLETRNPGLETLFATLSRLVVFY